MGHLLVKSNLDPPEYALPISSRDAEIARDLAQNSKLC